MTILQIGAAGIIAFLALASATLVLAIIARWREYRRIAGQAVRAAFERARRRL